MREKSTSDPLHGVTLKMILAELVAHYGWEEMGRVTAVRCFIHDPGMASSLKFLRRTPWARDKVEEMYLRWKMASPDQGDQPSIPGT